VTATKHTIRDTVTKEQKNVANTRNGGGLVITVVVCYKGVSLVLTVLVVITVVVVTGLDRQ